LNIIDMYVLTDRDGNATLVADLDDGTGEVVAMVGGSETAAELEVTGREWLEGRGASVEVHPLDTRDPLMDTMCDWLAQPGVLDFDALTIPHFENESGIIQITYERAGVYLECRRGGRLGWSYESHEVLTREWRALLASTPHDEVTADRDGSETYYMCAVLPADETSGEDG
jgi:hypothetical protein